MASLFRAAGHDAATVLDQELGGCPDRDLTATRVREGRALVSFDMDFSDIRAYPPGDYGGLIVFRLKNQARDHLLEVAARLLDRLRSVADLRGQLWVVEESRIRLQD